MPDATEVQELRYHLQDELDTYHDVEHMARVFEHALWRTERFGRATCHEAARICAEALQA